MARYQEVKEKIIEEQMFVKVLGIPLDVSPSKRWIAIRPHICICVTEPCPCDKLNDDILDNIKFDDIIIWLSSDVNSESTGVQWEGNDVYSYQLDADSKVMVEAQLPIAINDLQKMKEMSEDGRGQIIAYKGKKSMIGGLLIGAFELGWHIGEKIDEETGASGKLADWLYDNLGPWPPW